jgi:DNA-binding transcriptional regulator YiaG
MTLPELLAQCHLSQAQAAHLCGVSLRTMNRWCAGQNAPKSVVIEALTAYAKRMARAREELQESLGNS